ncbi:hypothetical protein DBB42_08110 [Pseudomonas plecoglossicida]|uniref:Uncharacterized protein n=1 Tax=Pseudomonas plecoglossicida TaxID=70775 RepID=A0A2R7UMQ6_PSEDL|nr:hypothetical protein DBB42_08110 [Pseudomonas plecoglossicida]
MSRKGCKAAPTTYAPPLKSRGRSAALSRHKAAAASARAGQVPAASKPPTQDHDLKQLYPTRRGLC